MITEENFSLKTRISSVSIVRATGAANHNVCSALESQTFSQGPFLKGFGESTSTFSGM